MRRLLTAVAVAAAPSLASFAAADPAAAASCTLGFVCINADFPTSPVAFGTHNAATTADSAEQSIAVSGTAAWGVKISADLAGGRMKEWTGSAYVGAGAKVMQNPLQWRLSSIGGTPQSTSFSDLSSAPVTLATNQSTTCLLALVCGSVNIGTSFRLRTSFSDPPATPNSYRIRVTYDAQLGF